MLVGRKSSKRLAIYFIYDGEGKVDDYIPYMLEDLTQNVDDLFVVINGQLQEEEKDKLYKYTDRILERENVGMDVWAYKESIETLGWETLESYDEIVMMNYTIMGPVYPLREAFDTMAVKDLDFWGLTKFHKTDFDPFGTMPEGYIPEHIQSHFIVVRKSMVKSESFHKYWEEMPMINGYKESVGRHEAAFTKHFADKGFKWEVYVNTDDLEGFTYHPIIGASVRLLRDKRCPVFKRRSFMQDYSVVMSENCGQEGYELYRYLKEETDYDMDLLWDNLLRVENMADLKKNLQLNYFLPSRQSDYPEEELKKKKIALFMHMYFPDLIEECYGYARSMPEHADIYITTDSEEKREKILDRFKSLPCNKLKVTVVGNRGRDVSAFLVEARDVVMEYDYVCQMHDKKVQQLKPGSVGAGFSYKCFENMLCSKDYVKNIIKTFEENNRLGMLMPPPPNHGQYYITLGWEWGPNYEVTRKLAEELGIRVPLDEKKEPIAPLGTVFWLRPKALKTLFDRKWTYDDFPKEPAGSDGTIMHALERIYGICVQHEGYYPAWVMSDFSAGMEVTNLNYMLRTLNEVIFYHEVGAGGYSWVMSNLRKCLLELRAYRGICDIQGKPINNVGKLYIQKKGAEYTERNTELSINEGRKEKYTYIFSGLDAYGAISGLRFDPSDESGVAVEELKVKIKSTNGHTAEYDLLDAQGTVAGNGIYIDGKILFPGDDPQIYLPLEGLEEISDVEIDMKLKYEIALEEIQKMAKLIRRGEKISAFKFI